MKIFVFIIMKTFKTLQICWKVDYFSRRGHQGWTGHEYVGALENIFSPRLSVGTAYLTKLFD